MSEVLAVRRPEDWEEVLAEALRLQERGVQVVIVALEEAVRRCVRCEPDLFRRIHQVAINGGRLCVCLRSLAWAGIPAERPPEVFERVPDGRALLGERR